MSVFNSGLTSDIMLGIILSLVACIVVLVLIFSRRLKKSELMAVSDPVTGSLNAAGFLKTAESLQRSENRTYAVVAMDLRNFRQIRLTFGSSSANRVLIHLLTVLSGILSTSEPVARINNSTFCFFMKNIHENEIRARLTRIYESANSFNRQRRDPYHLDLLFGIYIPSDNSESPAEMQDKALRMLDDPYADSRYRFFKDTSDETRSRKQELIKQMDHSLQSGDFIVYLQPKVRLGDNRIVGAEALVRWRHPQRGLLTPDQFVPQLAEYHVIHRLDRYLFDTICKKLAQWKLAGLKPCPISINLSVESLEVENYLENYARLCKQYKISTDLIEFELSESLLNDAPAKLLTLVDEIHSYGFQCSLDNFGKTSIPLHLLRDLDVDTIKLDSSFFAMENNSRRNRFIIEAILKIATQMHIRTVAQGIDSASQVQYLQQAACDMIQGFYYFRPMTMDEFRKVAYQDGDLRYIETDSNRPAVAAKRASASSIVMFSYLPTEDKITFSDEFSPVLDGQLTLHNASALLRRSILIHENDRNDFFHLMERCMKEDGWVSNTLRFHTAEGHYDWLEVYLHKDRVYGTDDFVISGTLVNLVGWKNEVDRWKEKANRDALTGIYNREYFEQTAANVLNTGNTSSAAIVFIDIDDFKSVNDTLGHMVGDDVLCCVAKRILGVFRHTDIVARYGGDEFVVFVNGIGRADLETRLNYLCDVFRFPYRNDTIEYQISGSIGAAMYPDDGGNYAELLDRADTAVYAAKGRGKDQFVLYEPHLEASVSKDKR